MAVGGETGRPEGELDACGRLGIVKGVVSGIPGVSAIEGTHVVAVDRPGQGVGFPVEAVSVDLGLGVGGGQVDFVVVWKGCQQLSKFARYGA